MGLSGLLIRSSKSKNSQFCSYQTGSSLTALSNHKMQRQKIPTRSAWKVDTVLEAEGRGGYKRKVEERVWYKWDCDNWTRGLNAVVSSYRRRRIFSGRFLLCSGLRAPAGIWRSGLSLWRHKQHLPRSHNNGWWSPSRSKTPIIALSAPSSGHSGSFPFIYSRDNGCDDLMWWGRDHRGVDITQVLPNLITTGANICISKFGRDNKQDSLL